uniref:Uncharacterized protein n=1 Tax=Romanomermis culicivorax TaxID=13658 RepID=A0A915JGE0_ROMCU
MAVLRRWLLFDGGCNETIYIWQVKSIPHALQPMPIECLALFSKKTNQTGIIFLWMSTKNSRFPDRSSMSHAPLVSSYNRQRTRNMMKPWAELSTQKVYINGNRAGPKLNAPKIHVTPNNTITESAPRIYNNKNAKKLKTETGQTVSLV